jgi:PAS domain S-box-containing protein
MTYPKSTLILTHRDVDGVCAAAIAKASYPKAKIEFANPPDFVSMLDSLSGYDCVIILDLGIDGVQKDEAIAAFRKLSTTSRIIYIDHHLRPPRLTKSSLACKGAYRTDASTSELAWEFFKPAPSHDFIAVLGAIGDYKERTPQIQGLIERYDERKVYPEALFLEWALMVSEDSFKQGVVEELVQGKWPYQMSIMGKEADAIVRRQRTLERYVREKVEKICERVMLIRDPPFKATGPAATLLTKLDNVDIGMASRIDENHVYLSLRRHEESDINLASLIDQIASKFGGMGGGHAAAAGGKIPVGRFDEVLLEIGRRLPERRLKRINTLDVGSVDKKKIERKLFKEIIERRRAEEMVKESEEKYRIQFEAALDAIFVADAETGTIIDCNRAALQLVGREKSEIIGQHQRILHPPEEIAGEFSRTFKSHIKEKADQVLEAKVITKKGEIRDVAIKANLFEFMGRKMIQGIFRDITESKWAEDKFRNLAENSPNMIFINKSGRVVYANKRCEELMGYKREEFYSPDFDFFTLIAPKCIDSVKKSSSKHEKGKEVTPYEYTLITKEGKRIEAILTTKLIQYEGKSAILGTVTDITEHKKAELKIRSERELYRSIARAVNRSKSLEELCELALNGIQKVIKYDLGDVMVYHESENALSSVAQLGFPRDLYERTVKWLDLKDGSKVAAQAALKKKGIYIDDVKTSKLMSRIHDLVVKYEISTMYVVPLFSRGKLQGVLEVSTVGEKVLSKEDREVLDTISEELAGGIAKAKSEEHLVTVKEAFGWLAVPAGRAPSLDPKP